MSLAAAISPADTVDEATKTPQLQQPYADLGLAADEYDRIREVLGRRPTECELAMYSVMWSEHCSYKSSRVHLRQFSDLPHSERLLAGIGENAGVVAVSDDLAVTFKVESHNHPSYVEPYQGAATGVGGIVRDILAMGARPIAVMDSLRFGDIDHPDTARLLPGVVAGVGGYGNCLGLPNIGGEIAFDPSYNGNPLVNALCLGVLPRARLQTSKASGVGNQVILFGARTGRDGIGGVSVLASATFDEGGPAKRPAVQVGDPFTEKVLTECTLEMYERGLVVGIQDLGGAGFTCAISETAAAGGQGMRVLLDSVPLREASMQPFEVLCSESQERMLAIVERADVDEVLALCRRWGVLATVVGEVTGTGRLIVDWHGETVVDVPPGSLAEQGPVYHRPLARPVGQDALQADSAETLPRPRDLRAEVLRLISAPNNASARWVTDQYDRYVQHNTVLAMPEDAGVVRITGEGLGVALSLDGPGRFAALDPYAGAQLALAEAARNVATTGAVPVAVTNCMNFGSPEDPAVMWQFAEAVRGLADGCRELGLPVTGGNVSFYNQTGDVAINPTPVVGVLGVIDDVRRGTSLAFAEDGDVLLLLGTTGPDLSGSDWAWTAHRHLGGLPPAIDWAAERALQQLLVTAAREGLLTAAHDLSGGGLIQAVVESCLRGGRGAQLAAEPGTDPFVFLFSESAGRVVCALPPRGEQRLLDLCTANGLPARRIGTVGGSSLDIDGVGAIDLDELRAAHEGTLPARFG
ncbi:MAG TPA: phosphoribosylformylglycinamidine synthase subunit PurL [Mycobacteriales bacterium]|nr:phosphoribosylformylglycinamidine synthase subunit PurL [Mycobacteriales bacterium]